jgi:eukaryotic-like serine/threonine-protein kinase
MLKLKKISNFFSGINTVTTIVSATGTIVSGIIGGIIFLQSEKELVTYPIPDYGIKLSYPKNWTKDKKNPGTERGSILILNPPNSRIECPDKVVFEIIKPEKSPSSLEMYETDEIDRLNKMNQGIKINNETTVKTQLSQIPAFRLNYQREDSQCGSRKVVEIATINNGKIYSILYDANPQSFERDLATVNKIIESFKLD